MSEAAVQSLWIGGRLSTMGRLGIESFLANGHDFHLYCYDEVQDAPPGTRLHDAREILPPERVFTYASGFGKGSYSAFSNVFRYKLLLDRGGWWVDTDVVCLRHFDFEAEQVLGSEDLDPQRGGGAGASSSVIKQPAGSALMQWAWDECQRKDPTTLIWGQIGPRLLRAGVEHFGCRDIVQPPATFSPVPFFKWQYLIETDRDITFGDDVYAVHLWHQMWRAHDVDPNGRFPQACVYEQLKRRFLECV